MTKFNLKLNLIPDHDKLSFEANPYRDWAVMFSVFICLLVVLAAVHVGIYFYLKHIENSVAPTDSTVTIDQARLNKAVEIINDRGASGDLQ